jgi:hypothetical protein
MSVKTEVIPVVIGATGTISKSFRKYLGNVPGKHDIRELQKQLRCTVQNFNSSYGASLGTL